MAFIDEHWLRKAHQSLRAALDVDAATRREMIQFLFDEGFWDQERLSWDSAVARFNDCLNASKQQFFKIGEVWALTLRFQRPQLLQAMASSMGYELRAVPTEARRIELLEQILANQRRFEEAGAELAGELQRMAAAAPESRMPSRPGEPVLFSFPPNASAVAREGCP